MKHDNILMVADSEKDANMLYAVGFVVPDPLIYLQTRGESHIVVNEQGVERARKKARRCRVWSLSALMRQLKPQGKAVPKLARVIRCFLNQLRIKRVLVPQNFPHRLGMDLRRLGVKIKASEDGVFAARAIKTADEVKKISAALIMAEVGLAEALQVLKSSKITKHGRLLYHDGLLTADKLRAVINVAVLQAGGTPDRTIVAGGAQTCDPHEQGHGFLRANQPIILDVFPRSQKTGYFGDLSRSVVRGRASEAVRKMYHTVTQAQALALRKLRDQTPGVEVHTAVQKFFENAGYKTGRKNGQLHGFFHATGHGLGLEIHEAPRLNATSEDLLLAGHVVSVEPGLYYPGIGGIRLEDVALVTHQAARNLTKFEKTLEL